MAISASQSQVVTSHHNKQVGGLLILDGGKKKEIDGRIEKSTVRASDIHAMTKDFCCSSAALLLHAY